MPQARSIWNYPEEFWQIAEAAALRGETREQELDTKSALSIRARFYGFKAAVKREAKRILHDQRQPNAQLVQARDQRVLDLCQRVDEVVCWTQDAGAGHTLIRFMHRDETKLAHQLRGFKGVGVAQPAADLEESARRLANELKPKTEKNYG